MSPAESRLPEQVALSLVFPATLEDDVLDACRDLSALVRGYTLMAAEGFGEGARLHSTSELVLGRARRRILMSIIDADQLDAVLAALRSSIASSDVVFWTTPVGRFGRLA